MDTGSAIGSMIIRKRHSSSKTIGTDRHLPIGVALWRIKSRGIRRLISSPTVSVACWSQGWLAGPVAERIRSVLLVAPCDLEETERLHPGAIDFGIMPRLHLNFPSLVVGSLNDHYMHFDRLQVLCKRWGSRLVDLGQAGHINIASGFGRWPAGYDLLRVLHGMAKGDRPIAAPAMPVRRSAHSAQASRQRTFP